MQQNIESLGAKKQTSRKDAGSLLGAWVKGWKEDSTADKVVFVLLLLLYTGVMLYLFVMQCYEVPDFVSDMPDYVNKVRGIKGNYEFPYPLFFTMAKVLSVLCGAPMAVAITTAILNSLGVWIVKGYMECGIKHLLSEFSAKPSVKAGAWSHGRSPEPEAIAGIQSLEPQPTAESAVGTGSRNEKGGSVWLDLAITFLTFSLFLLGNLYSPKNTAFFGFDYAYRCMGIYTPNPIWNATYLATRAFAVICFFEGCRVLGRLEELWRESASSAFLERGFLFWKALIPWKEFIPWKDFIPFALSLFLTTITKPSFTMVVVPTMGILLLIQLVRSRGKSFPYAFALCITMIPTGIDLLYQFFGVFTGTNAMGEETGIGFAIAKVWSNYSKNIPLSILMGMALPIGVLILNGKEFLKNLYYRFAWIIYLVSTLMFLCLYEKGFRMPHANFSWGYMHGMFFVYLITLLLMLKNTIQWRKSYKFMFVLAEWAVFFYHLACGINFLVYALQGKELAGF